MNVSPTRVIVEPAWVARCDVADCRWKSEPKPSEMEAVSVARWHGDHEHAKPTEVLLR